MVQCMLHDPSYSHGTYFAPELGCSLGWLTHPGAYADCNPVVDDRGDIALVFSGEHFVHDADRAGHSTPRCLLKQYIDVGPRFVEQINGWFSGVIVDRRSRSVLLFNDRYGVGRVYYHQSNGAFTFASEAKSLLSVRPDSRSFDAQGLGSSWGSAQCSANARCSRMCRASRPPRAGRSIERRQSRRASTSNRGPGPSSRCWNQRRSTRRFAAPSREFSRAISGLPCRSASRSPEGWTPGS